MAPVLEQAGEVGGWKPRSALLGTLLANRYRITQPIGQGSTGAVFRADDLLMNRPVAVRILAPNLAQNPALVSRIRARIDRNVQIQQLQPDALVNLVDAFDVGMTLEGELFTVSDFLDGDHLSAMLERGGRLPWSRARHLFIRLSQLLQALHERGIVLGTLQARHCYAVRGRPKNEAIKIVSTAVLEHIAANLGPGAGAVGAQMARYAAPEQGCGEPIDVRTDVYSFGVICYELLTGRVPFSDANPIRVVAQHLHAPPLPLRQAAPEADIPAAVEEVVLKALAKSPDGRYPDMAAFTAALSAIPADEGAVAAPAAPTAPAKPLASTLPVSSDNLSAPAPPVSSAAAAAAATGPTEPAPAAATAKIAPSVVMRVLDPPPSSAPAPAPAAPAAIVAPRRPPTGSMPTLIPSSRPSEPASSVMSEAAPAEPAAAPAAAIAAVSPAATTLSDMSREAPSAADSLRAPVPADSGRAPVPADSLRAPVPADSGRAPVPADSGRAPAPADSGRGPAPGDSVRGRAAAGESAAGHPAMSSQPDDEAATSWSSSRRPSTAPEIDPEMLRAAALRQSAELHPSVSQSSQLPTESIIAQLPKRSTPWLAIVGLGAALAAAAAVFLQTEPEPRLAKAPAAVAPPPQPVKAPPVAKPEPAPPPVAQPEPPPPEPVVTPPPEPAPEPAPEEPAASEDPAKKKKKKKRAEPEEEEEDLFDQVRKHMEAKKAAEAAANTPPPVEPPPPQPAPAPPKPAEDNATKARDTLDRARQAASQGNYPLAYSLAKQSNGLARTQDALELMGVSACKAGNADNARAAADQLTGARRSAVYSACSANGITL